MRPLFQRVRPVFRIGREEEWFGGYGEDDRVTAELLELLGPEHLLCSTARVATSRGIWVCPILVNESGGRMGDTLEESFRPFPLSYGDCACGYTDPRDNHFAALSYAYTFRKTSERNKDYLATLPEEIRLRGPKGERILLCHGSPRRQNEFLWESLSPDPFLARLLDDARCDVLAVTHTGIPWKRRLPDGRFVVNVGAIGRPANDGQTHVWYAVLDLSGEAPDAAFIPLRYDHERLADEMRAERIVEPFVKTVETGWWTTCLEILPAKERARGMY